MRRLAIATTAIAIGAVGVSTNSSAEAPATPSPTEAPAPTITPLEICPELYRQDDHRAYAQAVFRRQHISQRARHRMKRMRSCAYSSQAKHNMREIEHMALKHRHARQRAAAAAAAVPDHLRRIAMCESHGNPRAISPGGTYRGKYQFSFSTWRAVGGRGDPAAAPESEQDRRAVILYRTGGPGHWPICQYH